MEKQKVTKKKSVVVPQQLSVVVLTEAGNKVVLRGRDFEMRSSSKFFAKQDSEKLLERVKTYNLWLRDLNLSVQITPEY